MSDKYNETIYSGVQTKYPQQLVEYLFCRFIEPMDFQVHRLLDVGCGKGTLLRLFNDLYESQAAEVTEMKYHYKLLDVFGIDKRDECEIMVGNKSFKDLRLFFECDVEYQKFPFADKSMTVVFSKSLIEHIRDPQYMIEESLRVLKPGGKIIIMTPEWRSQMTHFWDDHTHVHPYTCKSLGNLLKIHGFEDVICEEFYQLPYIWKCPWLQFVPELISLLPDSWKWKDNTMSNGRDRKWIRFSKEKMLLAVGIKK